jgi:hypothetical protein
MVQLGLNGPEVPVPDRLVEAVANYCLQKDAVFDSDIPIWNLGIKSGTH